LGKLFLLVRLVRLLGVMRFAAVALFLYMLRRGR
jgi:hypothetical protein